MDLALHEISEASLIIEKAADKDANVILGCVIDETLGEKVVVTVIATGFNDNIQVPVAVGAGIGDACEKVTGLIKTASQAQGDAMITNQRHVGMGVVTAGGVQVLVYDPVQSVIAA